MNAYVLAKSRGPEVADKVPDLTDTTRYAYAVFAGRPASLNDIPELVPANVQFPPLAQEVVQRSIRYESIVALASFVHATRTEVALLFVAVVVSGAGGNTVTVTDFHGGVAATQPLICCTS